MKSQVLQNFDLMSLTIFAFFLFFGLFICLGIWTFHKSNKERFKNDQQIPLSEGELNEAR